MSSKPALHRPALPFGPAALPRLVTLREASIALGISPRTLRRRIRDGSLAARRIEGRLYLLPEDVRAFVERHREILIE